MAIHCRAVKNSLRGTCMKIIFLPNLIVRGVDSYRGVGELNFLSV
jgi:hypothetical protein